MKKIFDFIKNNIFWSGLIISSLTILIVLICKNGIIFPFETIASYWGNESSYVIETWYRAVMSSAGENTAADQKGNDSSDQDGKDSKGENSSDPAAKNETSESIVSAQTETSDGATENATENTESSVTETETAESTEETAKVGVTKFITYPPSQVDSKYYSDPGKIALTTEYDYITVTDDSYFDDAAFIGDSRMLGLNDYSGWTNADFYCDNGFCTYDWANGKGVTFQKQHKKMTVEDAMAQRTYTKIYLMIGMNDCGYGTTADFKQRLTDMISMLEEKQPSAVIYLMANLHVSQAKAQGAALFNNIDINDKNVAIGECADGIKTFFLDYNGLYTDENGFLKADYTFDGAHLYARNYQPWLDYIKSHVVSR